MAKRRVGITGIGAVTPLGNDRETTWRSLVDGRSGVGPITTFDTTTYPVHIAGMVRGFDPAERIPDRRLRRYLSRSGAFGVAASLEAVEDADAWDVYSARERGIAMAGSVGRPPLDELAELLHVRQMSGGKELLRQAPHDVMVRAQGVPVAVIARAAGCQGPPIQINTACAASAHAIGEAYRRIQDGEARLMIAGGYDALTSYLDVLGFALLGALTTKHRDEPERASRPFDRERDGFVLGEGAIALILEDLDGAEERGARIYAEVTGFGSSMNAYRITDSPPDGEGATLAISCAISDAGARPDEVDYVAAHGTGTLGNDLTETVALKRVFGEHAGRLAISSPKSMAGHLCAAAGGLNVLAATLAIRDQVAPPTINLEHPDPKLDLDYVPGTARRMPIRAALANAFAFGGTNASLLLRNPN